MNTNPPTFPTRLGRCARLALVTLLWTAVLFVQGPASPVAASTQTDIHGPAGSGQFGQQVTVLPNGNFVVTDPGYAAPGNITAVGAVYLYNGATGALISALTGSTSNDKVGSGGVTVFINGNFVVTSPDWHNGTAAGAGAVTWGNGATGVSGAVSATNSLVGSKTNDQVGTCEISPCITKLSNGNYLVVSTGWNGFAGAVTWGSSATGVSGVVSSANSLVGSAAQDAVGDGGVTALGSGNYIVVSSNWHNNSAASAGAVTWGNGATGTHGVVSSSNSLVGSTAQDAVGSNGVTVLSNDNYLVMSSKWNNGAATIVGAVTWGSDATGVSGVVSSANSLVGSITNDQIGSGGVTLLANGNYVVQSPFWHNGATVASAGAVSWGNGATGTHGVVSPFNSLVGSTAQDAVGVDGVTVLSNDNYLVASSHWNNNAGAVTWGSDATGVSGTVSKNNSLVGSTAQDAVGYNGLRVLNNGNYVVASPDWDNGNVANVGAVTWGNGATGISGVVSATNSLVGSTADDRVGDMANALSNGNYVVASPNWNNGNVYRVGAVTWGNGATGIKGVVSATNSLVGHTNGDYVGDHGVMSLSNGNYVVLSPAWHNATIAGAGAVTWGNGATGISGVVSANNSLVGSTAGDQVGSGGGTTFSSGSYVVYVVVDLYWHNGAAVVDAGAVTWANGATGVSGAVSAVNSLVGSSASDKVGSGGISVLNNGNYVVLSPIWNKGATGDAGAATWGNGATGVSGAVSAANSLAGSSAGDQVGSGGITVLSNGSYVVQSPNWYNGAVTWGNGAAGVSGAVSTANSLVGATAGDQAGIAITALSNGNYVVRSPKWDNGATVDAGAITYGAGAACSTGSSAAVGQITSANSVRGAAANGGTGVNFAYDFVHQQLVVGRPADNIVSLFAFSCSSSSHTIFLPIINK